MIIERKILKENPYGVSLQSVTEMAIERKPLTGYYAVGVSFQ